MNLFGVTDNIFEVYNNKNEQIGYAAYRLKGKAAVIYSDTGSREVLDLLCEYLASVWKIIKVFDGTKWADISNLKDKTPLGASIGFSPNME